MQDRMAAKPGRLRCRRIAATLLACAAAGSLASVAIVPSDSAASTTSNAPPSCGPIDVWFAGVSPWGFGATAPFTDPDIDDTHTAVLDWGDGTTSPAAVTEANGSGSATALHAYTVAGWHTLTLTVTDNENASGTCSSQVWAGPNAAPIVTAADDQASDEGENMAFDLGSFTDVNQNGPWEVRVSFGDGSPPEVFSRASPGTLQRSHLYYEDGAYTVTVRVEDAGGASDTDTFHVVVSNLPPSCGPIDAPLAPVPVGTVVTATASFTDPGVEDTHTAVLDWGDGTTSPAAVTDAYGSGSVTATHTFTATGIYTLTLTVTDDENASGTCTFQYVVVGASAGFVTAEGWINSPAGAYPAKPGLTGKATFAFVSKYRKGASVPDGNTTFQFTAANLSFRSSEYEWLAITGARAKFKGAGTLNGAGDYAFLVTAIDGQQSGDGVDKVRIKIWDNVTGTVLYDDQPGASDDSSAATALGGGSIVIHN